MGCGHLWSSCGITEAAVASCCIKCKKLHHFPHHEGFRWWISTIYLCPPAFICEPEMEICWEMFNHWVSCGGGRGEYYFFPGDSVLKNPPANAGDTRVVGLIPGSGQSPLLQYSCLENPMDRGNWWAIVHGFDTSQTWLSNWALPRSHLTHHCG